MRHGVDIRIHNTATHGGCSSIKCEGAILHHEAVHAVAGDGKNSTTLNSSVIGKGAPSCFQSTTVFSASDSTFHATVAIEVAVSE